MAKAKQLPSGAWRVRATHTDENGVQMTASFTDANPKVAEAKAAMWVAGMLERDADLRNLPLGDAIDAYIETGRCTGMSPSTIKAYVSARNNAFTPLLKKRINKITLRDVQSWVNWRAKDAAAKTVKNNLDLLVCVLRQNEVRLDLDALRLPKTQEGRYGDAVRYADQSHACQPAREQGRRDVPCRHAGFCIRPEAL